MQRLITEAVDAELVAQVPESDKGFVRRKAILFRYHRSGVKKVLSQAEYLRIDVWQPHNMLEVVIGLVLRKVFLVKLRSVTEKVLLYAKGLLVKSD